MGVAIRLPSLKSQAKEYGEILREVIASGVPQVTAFVMAGDIQSMRRVDEMVAVGEKPRNVVWMIGSYARFEWAVNNLPKSTLLAMLPELWIASDPDDTKPEYLALWKEARLRKGRVITDGDPLPKGKLTIYRGQVGSATGISWTLDKKIAERFAKTGGGRGVVSGGKVYTRRIKGREALAFLTQRSESEVIIDPF